MRELSKFDMKTTTIIEGEAQGADLIARDVGSKLGFDIEPYPANWTRYRLGAGPVRNSKMLTQGYPDLVLAFHENIEKSKGTKDMIAKAEKAGVEVRLFSD